MASRKMAEAFFVLDVHQNMIPSLKLVNPKLNLACSKVLRMVNYTLWSNIKGLFASKKNGRKIEGCIRESTANEMISCISSLGCMSIASISFALRILMSKV